MKNKAIIFFGIILVLFAIILIFLYSEENSINIIEAKIKNQTFYLQKAITQEEKEKGLMNVKQLDEDKGMIFIYNDEQPRMFWMKNTLIPLDQIFINENKEVVDIKQNFQPCIEDPCPSFISKPAMYVIEIKGGLAEKLNLNIGDKLEF